MNNRRARFLRKMAVNNCMLIGDLRNEVINPHGGITGIRQFVRGPRALYKLYKREYKRQRAQGLSTVVLPTGIK